MSMLKTIQMGYVPMRTADITVADTKIDPTAPGYTYHEHDRPTSAYRLGEEANAAVIIFESPIAINDSDAAIRLWGYPAAGPAEFICDASVTIGNIWVNDITTDLYADTIVIGTQAHLKTVSVADSANGRIAKLAFDCVGYKYLYMDCSYIDANTSLRPLIRTF